MMWLLLLVLLPLASSSIAGRTGFEFDYREWDTVVGKTVDEAKDIIRRDLPNAKFSVVSLETYSHTPSEGYTNMVLLGVDDHGVVCAAAKYSEYAPNLDFLRTYVGKPYTEAVTAIKEHLPSCNIVVVHNGNTVFSCCGLNFLDHLNLEVDANDLLLKLPEFVPDIHTD